jgi:signal transduction histidine kinase
MKGGGGTEALKRRVAELEAELARHVERDHSILEIAAALGTTLDLDHLLELIMGELTKVMDAERSTLFLVDEATGTVWSKIAQEADVREIRLQPGEGIAGYVAATGNIVNAPDAYADPRFQPAWDQRTGFRTKTVLCHPVRNRRGEIVGAIQVLNKRGGAFDATDETLVAALAGQVAVSIENAKLYQSVVSKNVDLQRAQTELEHQMQDLEFLYRTELEAHDMAEEAAIEHIIAQTAGALDVEAGSVLLRGEGRNELFFKHTTGSHGEALKRARLAPGQGIAGWVSEHGEAVLTNEPQRDERHHWALAEAIGAPARSILCVPLRAGDTVVGAFELINKRSGGFTETDLKLLTLVSASVTRVVQQVRHREEQARASRLADLGQMLSGILHDFKTPMTIISGYAQLMVNEKSAAAREESCSNILRQFEHLGNMTREILAFARGETRILFRRVYVHKFMEEIEELLRSEFRARRIDFSLDLRYRGTARFDEGKMRRAIYNISRNAMEAMPSGSGSFRMVVDREDDELVLSFADTGPGVPEDILPRLFQSFVTKGKVHGTGLGLAIVKKIVDDHHGTIRCESEPGRGTTFIVRVPLDPEGAGNHHDAGGEPPPAS